MTNETTASQHKSIGDDTRDDADFLKYWDSVAENYDARGFANAYKAAREAWFAVIDSRAPAAQAASVPQKWIDVMQELVDLIDDAADGQYEIDTFTAQPGRELLATVPQQEGSEAGNG